MFLIKKHHYIILRHITSYFFVTLGRLIQTNSGAREHLLFEIPAGTRKTMGTDAVIRTDWSTFTSVIGPTVKGNLKRHNNDTV